MSLFRDTGADFGDFKHNDDAYRYTLYRTWDPALPVLAFCMLNPSTADEVENDPTVERCERRAALLGYGKLIVVNAFALRSTDPSLLYKHPSPIGPRNNSAIMSAAREAREFVCGWGQHGLHEERGERILRMLRSAGLARKLRHLGLNRSGMPRHPLYVAYKAPLLEFRLFVKDA